MHLNVEKELAALRRMSVGELRLRYAEVFGEPTRSRHKQWLIKRILWRMQALAEGDLSERARRWVVERTHSWFNRFRRLLIRWEKKAENYVAFVHFACAWVTFRAAGILG